MMRILLSVALIAVTGFSLRSDRSGVQLSDSELGNIRGNQTYYCAFAYPTSGGCTDCLPNGTATVTYSYVVNGVTYTYSYNVPVYKKCNIYQPDEKCWVSSAITTSACIKTTSNACTGASSGYSDSSCNTLMASQPAGGFSCVGTYSDATSATQTGVNCSGVTSGIF